MGFLTKALLQSALPGSIKFVSKFTSSKADAPRPSRPECCSSGGFSQAYIGSRGENSPSNVKSTFMSGEKKTFLSTKRWFATCLEKKASVFVQKQQQKTGTSYEPDVEAHSAPAQKGKGGVRERLAVSVFDDNSTAATIPARVTSIAPRDATIVHTVQWGETLCSIARKYDADVDGIAEFNSITDTDRIQHNMRLVIPGMQLLKYPHWHQTTWQQQYEKQLMESSRVQRRATDRFKSSARPAALLVSQRSISKIQTVATPSVSHPLSLELVATSGVLAAAMGCGVLMSLVWNKLKSFAKDNKPPKGLAGRELRISADAVFGKQDLLQRTQVVLNDNRSTFVVAAPRISKARFPERESSVLLQRMTDILNDRTIGALGSPFASATSVRDSPSRTLQSATKTPVLAVPG